MRLLVIIFLFLSGCTKAQTGYLGRVVYDPTPLFIMAGESNAGGYALNDPLTAHEAAPRSSAKILNNSSYQFQTLDIGTNNLINHYFLTDNATHGIENGLANCADSGLLGNTPMYLVKAGLGSSRIRHWTNPDTLYNIYQGYTLFKQKVDTAITQMTAINNGTTPQLYLIWTQGINDAIYEIQDAQSWKDSTKSLFAQMRTRYGNMPIFIMYLPTTDARFTTFNTKITEIAAEVSECYAISVTDAPMRDSYHWNYAGWKIIASRIAAAYNLHYP